MALLILVSSFYTANAQAGQVANPAVANWNGGDGSYGINNNYSPQETINASNVGGLVTKWTWPTPVNTKVGDQGIESAAMIIGGVIYVLSQSQFLEAINANNGNVIWSRILPISYDLKVNVLDSHPCTGPLNQNLPKSPLGTTCLPSGHYHDGSWAYTSSIYNRSLIWVDSNNYTVYAFDAFTGDEITHMFLYGNPSQISGNFGFYDNVTPQMTIDEVDKVLVVGASVADQASAGRGFMQGYSLSTNPPSLLWTSYVMPPNDGSDPAWSLNSVADMSHAWIFNGTGALDLKALPQNVLHDMLNGDWGNFGFNGTEGFGGTGVAFGGPFAFNPKTHVMYVPTGNASPDWNATFRPGPNLWSNSILALNVLTGRPVWGFQTTSHDLWDYDCAWNVILGNATINGAQREVVYKSCKNSFTYALDAQTGQLLWYFTVANAPWFKPSNFWVNDPLNRTEMTRAWVNSPSTSAVVQNPGLTGTPESNMAYDPAAGTLFVADFNNPQNITHSHVPPTKGAGITSGGLGGIRPCRSCVTNTTLYALDGSTGKVKWNSSLLIPLAFRGGLAVSGGVVYMPSLDGILRLFDERSGTLLGSINIGGPMATQPAIGETTSGATIIVLPIGVSEEFQGATPVGVEVPGYVTELGLPSPSTTITPPSGSTGIAPALYYATAGVAVAAIVVIVVLLATRRRWAGQRSSPTKA